MSELEKNIGKDMWFIGLSQHKRRFLHVNYDEGRSQLRYQDATAVNGRYPLPEIEISTFDFRDIYWSLI